MELQFRSLIRRFEAFPIQGCDHLHAIRRTSHPKPQDQHGKQNYQRDQKAEVEVEAGQNGAGY